MSDDPTPHGWAMAQVGEYMQLWAMTEAELNRVIRAALSLDVLQSMIITADLFVATKIKIATAAVHVSKIPDRERPKFIKRLNEFLSLTGERNMVAHRLFFASKEPMSVDFYIHDIKKGPLESRVVTWSDQDFETRFKQLEKIRRKLEQLPKRIEAIKLADVLADPGFFGNAFFTGGLSGEPMPKNALRGLLTLGSLPPLEHPSSDPPDATHQTETQMPEARVEKD